MTEANEPIKLVSSCCFEEMNITREPNTAALLGYTVMYDCKACGSACTAQLPPCPDGICDGSGRVGVTAYDSDSHNYYPDGDEPCPHTVSEPDHDPDL